MSDKIPQPKESDLQAENTQLQAEQIKAAGSILEEVGRKWEKRNWQKRNQSKPDEVKVEIEKGTKHKQLYEKYSENTNSNRPVRRTLKTAREALRSGHSQQETAAILSHDPQIQQVKEQQGEAKANKHTQQMIRSVVDREKKAQQGQRQSKQQSQKKQLAQQRGLGGPQM
ncbi:MAG: hypothetical protein GVY04_05015 [Cyanobacteria bacterium]|jgi:hypothetical protein|nr:hypothetical protein [Cyanobacteria bacterium GSL.Bin1]